MNKDRMEALKRLVQDVGVEGLIIAGGAVRDAYLGIDARDIDFIVKDPGDAVLLADIIRKVRKATGVKAISRVDREVHDYDHSFELYRSDDETVEVIVVEVDEIDYVDNFHDDISKMWTDGESIQARDVALDAARLKTITVDRGRGKRLKKLRNKFTKADGWTVQYAEA